MLDKYLPLGSVVRIDGTDNPFMIIGYQIEGKGGKIFDYSICEYPQGLITGAFSITINHNDIKEVLFYGYIDLDYKNHNDFLIENEKEENYFMYGINKNDNFKDSVKKSEKVDLESIFDKMDEIQKEIKTNKG